MKKRYLLLLLFGWLFTACGSKSHVASYSVAEASPTSVTYRNPYISDTPVPAPIAPRRLVTTSASITVEVDKITEAHKKLLGMVEEMKGYIENDNLAEERGRYYARVKVPSAQLESALNQIGSLGEKVSQSVHKQDVTNSVSNQEEQLKNLKLFRDKMKTLLDRTSNIEEILKIERELNRVQTQIDMIERSLKQLAGQIEVSPIQVELEEKTIYGPLGYVGHGIWWAVKKLFVIR